MSSGIRQNKSASSKSMNMGSAKGLPSPAKPGKGTAVAKFEGTVTKTDGVSGVTKPAPGTAGSHDSKSRMHGGE